MYFFQFLTTKYIGYTSDIKTRLYSHNNAPSKGFTAKYRPWVVAYFEEYATKKEAILREKELKSATGRRFIHNIIDEKHKPR